MYNKVKTVDGYHNVKVYNVDTFPYHRLQSNFIKRRGVDMEYNNLPATFDIETSKHDDIAYMYIWQMCIHGQVVIGRTWKEFQLLLKRVEKELKLTSNRKMIIYSHNLSYEFKFMSSFIDIDDVFATDINKVLTVKSGCFEHRCSYFLSGKSLEKFLEDSRNPVYLKTKQDIDHKIKRTPATILTEEELGYCIIDVLGLYHRLLELLDEDNINTIPLTKTGYVRREVLKNMLKNKKNRYRFTDTKLEEEEYKLLKEVFRGGNTASSRYYCTKLINEKVRSFDISSSYPFQLLSKYFPVGKFRHVTIKNKKRLEQYNNNYCTVGVYIFTNLQVKEGVSIPYIPFSKCRKAYNNLAFNGRILSADAIEIPLTEIDFNIVDQQYTYDTIRVHEFMYTTRGSIPKELIEVLYQYFEQKSLLKGVEGMEYEYASNKELLNSMYGMIVQDPINEIIEYVNDEFVSTGEYTNIEDFYDNFKKILPYQWGIWVTAHARNQLQEALDFIGLDVIYTDTDSVKFIDNRKYGNYFDKLNEQINNECLTKGIKNYVELPNGKKAYMGIWDLDGEYKQFKTLGSKKYAYVDMDNNLKITVAGLNKAKGARELTTKGGIEKFNIGEVFLDSGRTSARYVTKPVTTINVDNVTFETGSFIYIEDVTYTLGISNQMQDIIDNIE